MVLLGVAVMRVNYPRGIVEGRAGSTMKSHIKVANSRDLPGSSLLANNALFSETLQAEHCALRWYALFLDCCTGELKSRVALVKWPAC